MVTKGCTSGYAIWNQMKRENEAVMAYKNIGRRVLLLHKSGYIEEIKLPKDNNIPWRKDYKLTTKGMVQLIPFLRTYPENFKTAVEYMDKYELDKMWFPDLLIDRITSMFQLLDKYLNIGLASLTEDQKVKLIELQRRMDGLDKMLELKPIDSDNKTTENLVPSNEFNEELPSRLRSKDEIAEDKEFLYEIKLSMLPKTTKKITKRSNVKELEMARDIAGIEATITELYENIRFLLRHHGIEIILERNKNKNKIILKRSVPQRDASVMRLPNEVKNMHESADKSIDRMKEASPLTTETIKKLEEIIYKINEFSLDKSVEVIEGITTTSKIDKKKPT